MPDPGTAFPLVLDAEDDALAVDALEDESFEVLEAPSAEYAVTLLQARRDIGVVFTDVTLPGTLNGFDLARLVRRTHPHVHVLVSSGVLPSGFSGVAPTRASCPSPTAWPTTCGSSAG